MLTINEIYAIRAAIFALILILWASVHYWPDDKPQYVMELRARHVLPVAGFFLSFGVIVLLGLVILNGGF